jgi:hypothetical protein
MKTLILIAFVVAFALTACGGEDDLDTADRLAGISIDQALAADGPAVVNGNLLVVGGEARLCDALAESFPPQCGGSSIVVLGLDLDSIDDLTSEGDVTWSDRPIRVEGVVTDDVLTVDENALE